MRRSQIVLSGAFLLSALACGSRTQRVVPELNLHQGQSVVFIHEGETTQMWAAELGAGWRVEFDLIDESVGTLTAVIYPCALSAYGLSEGRLSLASGGMTLPQSDSVMTMDLLSEGAIWQAEVQPKAWFQAFEIDVDWAARCAEFSSTSIEVTHAPADWSPTSLTLIDSETAIYTINSQVFVVTSDGIVREVTGQPRYPQGLVLASAQSEGDLWTIQNPGFCVVRADETSTATGANCLGGEDGSMSYDSIARLAVDPNDAAAPMFIMGSRRVLARYDQGTIAAIVSGSSRDPILEETGVLRFSNDHVLAVGIEETKMGRYQNGQLSLELSTVNEVYDSIVSVGATRMGVLAGSFRGAVLRKDGGSWRQFTTPQVTSALQVLPLSTGALIMGENGVVEQMLSDRESCASQQVLQGSPIHAFRRPAGVASLSRLGVEATYVTFVDVDYPERACLEAQPILEIEDAR